jgi:hypothetical protein
MTEADYWTSLEYRVTRELATILEGDVRSLWCDGFIPERYLFDEPAPRVTGRVWIATGPGKQDQWEFTLLLDESTGAREDISWSALLPADESTGWLTVDLDGQGLRLTPRETGVSA